MIFDDQLCNFHDYLIHGLQLPLWATSSPHWAYMRNAATTKYLHEHAYRQCKFCVSDNYFSGYWWFVKLFHTILWFFHDYSCFFKFHDLSMYGTLFSDFPGFPWDPELVGTLLLVTTCHLLITFANSLDPDQDQQNVGPDLDPNYLTLS